MKLASFNIDIDPIDCYYSIHGIKPQRSDVDDIWSKGVVRFLELLKKKNIKATFFVTASDFIENNREILKRIVEEGHEIGNHTYSHDYRFTLMEKDAVIDEIQKNHQFIKDVTGFNCVGFRSPGYNISPEVISYLKDKGYIYDSSFFPSPMYYFAKWLIIKIKRIRGRKSKSIIYSIMDCFGKKKPYQIGEKVRKEETESPLTELPITTVTPIGLPLIGTSVIVFPRFLYRVMLKLSLKREYINFEAHGIDLCQTKDSEKLEKLKTYQPDLKYDLDRKTARFEELIDFYLSNGYKFTKLDEIAHTYKAGE